tara:strand:- start:1215 stop:2000 length:786 start_codon:yes stop_codon:yes gene_type:complete
MALTFGTDLTVTGNIKLTEVGLVQGAWKSIPSGSTTGSIPIQRISDGQLYYIQSENRVIQATVTYNSETFQNEVAYSAFAWPSASYAVTASHALNGGGGGGVTISNNANNRVLTGDGSNANAEANLTFDGTTLTLTNGTGSLGRIEVSKTGSFGRIEVSKTGSFGRLEATTISASLMDLDASTLRIGGEPINKTLVSNIKQSFSSAVVQTADTVTTTAATGSFRGPVSASLFLLSEVQGDTPVAKKGGIMFSGSAFYLGFE